ncbi:dTDP-4-dehydrorhamnose 3,5-epimerase [Mariprofundus aestuarium]|uniref:dTDP-4-dehydrorhamnose 3,5-epimerase n=1 Tax=Mariprofundus aestuarium TaxID=1921086 RepID=A0A2K8L148_MARES|nr:dTDP-4-dehydrorhamnose 3,5-epimerase family protein [Mariprofundus aestuarium]ATX78644.1 dTDP-4-dehydrorhamnose 3,5-epimerase [Mariprofundus aestuarium]
MHNIAAASGLVDLNVIPTAIQGVNIVVSKPVVEPRGSFIRLFCEEELSSLLDGRKIVQINRSLTCKPGAIRGLHYQHPPHAEMKMVRCLKGRVWDVAVDLRRGSPTFLHYHAQELSVENNEMMIIPEGCAHGFQILEADSELLYLHTAAYAPDAEGGLRYDDLLLSINWPLPVSELSSRDQSHSLLSEHFQGLDT